MLRPQAAGRIHTDFEKGFIMADVMKFADFKVGRQWEGTHYTQGGEIRKSEI